jgi:hypothetical protein
MKYALALLLLAFSFPAQAEESKSAYERVLETRTIRCGYNYYEPVIWRVAKPYEVSKGQ